MTAGLLTRRHAPITGMRSVDPKRDMAAVASLVETAFAGNLDESGRRMLRWMQNLGRAGWLGWLLGWPLLPPAARPYGYVWEADGRLLGNASVLPVEGHPARWVLVNVAVHPEHRRRGIAARLVRACLEFVHTRGAGELILQVDQDNPGAVALYQDLGFEDLGARTTWVGRLIPTGKAVESQAVTRSRRRHEWQDQLALARRVHPEGVLWPFPLSAQLFRPASLAFFSPARHWVVEHDRRIVASLSARRAVDTLAWRLILIVEPSWRGRVEAPLLACAAGQLTPNLGRAVIDYPVDEADGPLRELAFFPRRTLTWMLKAFG